MKHLKTLSTAAFIFWASLCFSHNTAYLSRTKVLSQLKGYTSETKAYDSLKASYQKEIETTRNGIDEKFRALTAVYKPVNKEDLPTLKQRMDKVDQEKLKLLEEENKMLESRINSYNSILDQKYKTSVGSYIDKLNAAIDAYANKNKLEVVWDTDALGNAAAWLSKSRDIGTAILEKLR